MVWISRTDLRSTEGGSNGFHVHGTRVFLLHYNAASGRQATSTSLMVHASTAPLYVLGEHAVPRLLSLAAFTWNAITA